MHLLAASCILLCLFTYYGDSFRFKPISLSPLKSVNRRKGFAVTSAGQPTLATSDSSFNNSTLIVLEANKTESSIDSGKGALLKDDLPTIPTSVRKSFSSQFSSYFDAVLKAYTSITSTGGKKDTFKRTIQTKIAIIGAGISGLACAKELLRNGIKDFVIIDSSDDVGGRVRSDNVNGFILDRGFQVFIEQYPQSLEYFNYPDLKLNRFLPGAFVRYKNKFYLVSDPIRRPQDLLASIQSPIGSFIDKVKVGYWSIVMRYITIKSILTDEEKSTLKYLEDNWYLSASMIDLFFRPFYQGIFLTSLDKQSSRLFNFVFKMFTEGYASLPKRGIGDITQQLAKALPLGSLYLNTRINTLDPSGTSISGQVYDVIQKKTETIQFLCEKTVIATDPPAFQSLLNELDVKGVSKDQKKLSPQPKTSTNTSTESVPSEINNNMSADKIDTRIPTGRSSICLYYSIEGDPPIKEPILILNGENTLNSDKVVYPAVINNVCFPSQVSRTYAPIGQSLASVTVIGPVEESDKELESKIRKQLDDWFGDMCDMTKWTFLRLYRIDYAQPAQTPLDMNSSEVVASNSKSPQLTDNIYCCGDHRDTATLNGAIASGRRAAMAVVADINNKQF